ncbi:hypothetical protein [Lentzea sp. NBRC 105346]|uniref:hypothetical protein n=1 Tax=Lentzea sp. NBRC 105346 TaxID=3032205 RepID=UPI002554B187|nr:hypothetical protein [Lentzea sp. NBRC 105346]
MPLPAETAPEPPPVRATYSANFVGATLVIGAPEGPSQAASQLARQLPADRGRTVVVVDFPSADQNAFWPSVATALGGRGPVRLAVSYAGSMRPTAPGQWLADQLQTEVVAPDGVLTTVPGASFVVGTAGYGTWLKFAPGASPMPYGRRFPVPQWEAMDPNSPWPTGEVGISEPIPAGLWLRAQQPAFDPGAPDARPIVALPCRDQVLTVVIGGPGQAPIPTDEVCRLLTALPQAARTRVRLVPYGTDTSVGRLVADQLGEPIFMYTGLPVGNLRNGPGAATVAVDPRGQQTWRPFVTEVRCTPYEDVPAVSGYRPPVQGLAEVTPGVFGLGENVVLEVVPSGLWVREADEPYNAAEVRSQPVDPEWARLTVGTPGRSTPGAVAVSGAALVERLEPEVRKLLRVVFCDSQVKAPDMPVFAPAPPPVTPPPPPPVAPPPAPAPPSHAAPEPPAAGPAMVAFPTATPGEASRHAAIAELAASREAELAAGARPRWEAEVAASREAEPAASAGGARSAPPRREAEVAASAADVRPSPPRWDTEVAASREAEPAASAGGARSAPPRREAEVAAPAADARPSPPRWDTEVAASREAEPAASTAGARPSPPRREAEVAASRTARPIREEEEAIEWPEWRFRLDGPLAPVPPASWEVPPQTPSDRETLPADHRSSEADRDAVRRALGERYAPHAATVCRLLAQRDEGQEDPQAFEAMVTDLTALVACLSQDEEMVVETLRMGRLGRLRPYVSCVVSSLSRLPSFAGVTACWGGSGPTGPRRYRTGDILVDHGLLDTIANPVQRVGGQIEYVVWSVSGRRVEVTDRVAISTQERVIFPPGTAFRVLAVVEAEDDQPMQVMLQEVASDQDARVLSQLERAASALRALPRIQPVEA